MASTAALTGPIFITGGCGLLGRALTTALTTEHGVAAAQLHVFDLNTPAPAHRLPGATYVQGDIADEAAVTAAMQRARPAVVFHCASLRAFLGGLALYERAIVGGAANVLAAAQAADAMAFVFTSSSSVIHDAVSDIKAGDESWPVLLLPQQREPYHHCKALAEQLVRDANRRPRMLTAALRPSGLFGPGDEQSTRSFIDNAKSGRLNTQIGDNTNLVDWTYISNAADCHILAAKALLAAYGQPPLPLDKRVEGEVFFLTNGEPLPFWDFGHGLADAAGYPVDRAKLRVVSRGFALTMASIIDWAVFIFTLGQKRTTWRIRLSYSTIWRVFDISKARERLGYVPRVSMAEGMRLAAAPYRAEK